jgi:hypothetical protein
MSDYYSDDRVTAAIRQGARYVDSIAGVKISDDCVRELSAHVRAFMEGEQTRERRSLHQIEQEFGPIQEAAEAQFWFAVFVAEERNANVVTAEILQASLKRRCRYPPWCWPWRSSS